MARATAIVRITACVGSPRYRAFIDAEITPSASPSTTAYIGAVIGAKRGAKIVTIANTSPPSTPVRRIGVVEAPGFCAIHHQVYPADPATRRTSASAFRA